jgi:large subunit ribosomal protein L25
MSKSLVLNLEKRLEVGKAVRRLRPEGILPGSINRPGSESENVKVDSIAFEKIYRSVGRTQPIDIVIDGNQDLVMIKDVEREPIKGKVIHFTLQIVDKNIKVETEVPLHLDEEVLVPAKKLGLEVLAVTHIIEVAALPHDVPSEIKVDGSVLKEVGDRILVSDLKLPKDVELADEADATKVVFIVEAPRITTEADLSNDVPEADGEVPSDKGGEEAEAKTEA